MFAFSRGGEELKVYGRSSRYSTTPSSRRNAGARRRRRHDPSSTCPISKDTLDPRFVTGGRDFLLTTAWRAMDELRNANVPSAAFPGELLADVIPAAVITTLAVIEQTDDEDFLERAEMHSTRYSASTA